MAHQILRRLLGSTSGAAAAVAGVTMIGVIAIMALAIDHGYLRYIRTYLQGTADATALASVRELPNLTDVRDTAVAYAALNAGGWGMVVAPEEVYRGNWTSEVGFVKEGTRINAVRVIARRADVNGNAVGLWFVRFIGMSSAGVAAAATAVNSGGGDVVEAQFLIDAEMIDNDIGPSRTLRTRSGWTPTR